MMKRLCALLTALLLFCCPAFAEEETLRKAGEIAGDNDAMKHYQHLLDAHPEVFQMNTPFEMVTYDSLNDMMMALRRGDIILASCARSNAEYITARNDDFKILEESGMVIHISYSMLTLDKNAELYEKINQTIVDMKADGTMDALIERDIEGYIHELENPEAIELPVHEGAPTYRVAVCGDFPPMDFVLPDGKAAGFNVALLSEISNRTGVNFEIVTVSAAARMTALSADRVDVVFWTNASYCMEHSFSAAMEIEGTLITEPYFIDELARFVAVR